jgi:NADH:ubiquinone oxidoreductase subunit 3 (subunit A)
MTAQYIPVIMAFAFAAATAVALVGASRFLGRGRLRPQRKLETYESGMPLLDASRKRVSVKFFVVAMVFIVFDLEVAFLFPVAVAARELLGEGNTLVLVEVLVFLLILALGYLYLWRAGAFDWSRAGSQA